MTALRMLLFATACMTLIACSEAPAPTKPSSSHLGSLVNILNNKTNSEQDNSVTLTPQNASISVLGEGAAREITLDFDPGALKAGLTLKPITPWDWAELGDINLAVDVKNETKHAITLYTQLRDISGWPHARSVSIPPNSMATYYALLSGNALNKETGLRENPKSWQANDYKMFWMWGRRQLQLNQITDIRFYVDPYVGFGPAKHLSLSNIRIRQNPKTDSNYLKNLVDQYGQRNAFKTSKNITNDNQLKSLAIAEQNELDKQGPMPGRNKFGAWQGGPQLNATGYFRAEKFNDTWALIDPEGKLFFSSAISNIRIDNTYTFTGVDYTFKDSLARNSVQKNTGNIKNLSALGSPYVASELRRNMFTWLPPYDHPLANHYRYHENSKKGPLEQGETFSFYEANLERKYAEKHTDSYLDSWRDVTIKRMHNWGFTSFGNWVDSEFYQLEKMPYFASGWIMGDFKKIPSSYDSWSTMPDVFDPAFQRQTQKTITHIAQQVQNSPWCVGVFIDSEIVWGKMHNDRKRHRIALAILRLSAKESPSKVAFTNSLKNKYIDIENLNSAWASNYASWSTIENGISIDSINDNNRPDIEMLSYHYARQYFKTIHDELQKQLPHHLYMGAPMAYWGITPEALKAASEFVDVLSFNYYREGLHEKFWAFLKDLDKPILISEFHIGATNDTGLLHPGLVQASSQQERARMYQLYMQSVIDNPYVVGAHWFQYIDSPLTGRASDGENYNVGFVNVADLPYVELVNAAKEINRKLYENKYQPFKVN